MCRERHALRVLAVDDDPLIRELLTEVLAQAGCQLLTASDGTEAVRILEQEPVDFLITDYDMPRMNGLELVRWSKERLPHLTAVMITGQDCQALAAEGRANGASAVLLKPFSVEQILSLLREIGWKAPPP